MRIAERISRLAVESAFDVMAKARTLEAAGRHIIHLEIGEPDFNTPEPVIRAAKQALDEGWTHYGPPQGLPSLREAVAAYVSRTRRIPVDPQNVCVVPGAKPMLFFPMLALLEPGDEVLYPDPGFPMYRSLINFLEAKPIPIPLLENRGFSLDLDFVRDHLTGRTRLLILNSPHNPTGGVIPENDLRQLAELIRDRDMLVLADEIYGRITYDAETFSIASIPGMLEKTIIMDGFSKSYAMTGWRLGYGIVPPWLVDPINKLMSNSNTCAASFTQRAAISALNGSQTEVEQMVKEFRRRRDMFCPALNEIAGFRCQMPSGAFYAFANVEGTGLTSKAMETLLLEKAGVACLDGGAFGPCGQGYLRLSYANSFENLTEAVRRIKDASTAWTHPKELA
ncbi:MAG TPA: pyridoxal phosphate-dependent aminotransferase [Bryobacteraceae bacterium]|nr:pyridoxal phosphate-dependent aminotransferase [Bryobacteraceae bacterium]